MTLQQEYDLWLGNYEILLKQLQAAYRFKNIAQIDNLSQRILNTQVQIAICARRLKKEGNPGADSSVGSTVGGDVEISKYAPMYLGGIDWSGDE